MKKKPALRYALGLIALLKDTSRNVGEGMINQFVEGLSRNGKIRLLPAIRAAVERELAREAEKKSARVLSARPLDEKTRTAIAELLGKESVQTNVDTKLIGGIKITTDELLIDGTIAQQLKRLTAL